MSSPPLLPLSTLPSLLVSAHLCHMSLYWLSSRFCSLHACPLLSLFPLPPPPLLSSIEFKLCDYRHMTGQFDKIVSCEMLEVGFYWFFLFCPPFPLRLPLISCCCPISPSSPSCPSVTSFCFSHLVVPSLHLCHVFFASIVACSSAFLFLSFPLSLPPPRLSVTNFWGHILPHVRDFWNRTAW